MSVKKTTKTIINQKMRVLKDFYVVDDDNEDYIRKQMERALKDHPNEDPEVVLDHFAHPLIQSKLREFWED